MRWGKTYLRRLTGQFGVFPLQLKLVFSFADVGTRHHVTHFSKQRHAVRRRITNPGKIEGETMRAPWRRAQGLHKAQFTYPGVKVIGSLNQCRFRVYATWRRKSNQQIHWPWTSYDIGIAKLWVAYIQKVLVFESDGSLGCLGTIVRGKAFKNIVSYGLKVTFAACTGSNSSQEIKENSMQQNLNTYWHPNRKSTYHT